MPFISIALWISGWQQVPVVESSPLTPIWSLIAPVFDALPAFVRLLLMSLVVSASAIYFNLMLNRHEVLFKNSYFPAFFYVLFSSCVPALLMVHPLHFVNLLLLLVLDQGYRYHRQDRPVGSLFNAGLLVGCCCLLSLPLIPLVVFALFQLRVLRPASLREQLVLLTGLSLPFFYLAVIWFPFTLTERLEWLSRYVSHYRWSFDLAPSTPLILFAGLVLVVVLFSMLRLRSFYFKNIVRMRDFQQVVVLLLLFGIGTVFLLGPFRLPYLLLLVIPLAVFSAYYFISAKRFQWYYSGLFWLLLAATIWNHLPVRWQ